MRALVLLMALIVAGCNQQPRGPTLGEVERQCGYDSKPFTDSWPCVRTGLAEVAVPADLKGVYVATGNFIAEQVGSNKMTDTEAKLAMAHAKQRAHEATLAREPRDDSAMDAYVLSRIGNTPAPMPVAQPTFYTLNGRNIVCQRLGPTSVSCF